MDERYSRLRGFLDLYGDDVFLFNLIEDTFIKYTKAYGFEEIKLPILERTELFVRSIGEGSDIVAKEMFSFEDKGGRKVTMRPEGTAGVVRAILENNLFSNPKYHKVYYIGPMFRAERPQAGRLRQFHQIGVEWFGSDSVIVDFETISLLWNILLDLKISPKVDLVINSVGCDECVHKYKDDLKVFFDKNYENFCKDCKTRREKNVLRIFDCKNHSCQNILKEAPKITDKLCKNCVTHLESLENWLSKASIPFLVDPHLVRGLDYYTRNVFEVRYRGIGAQNAIAGGGRYNNLVSEFGGPNIPAFGFAMGVERTILALKENITVPEELSVAVCSISPNEAEFSLKVASLIRSKGLKTHVLSYLDGIGKQMKTASKIGVKFAIIVGEDEVKEEKVTLKNMATGEQKKLPLTSLAETILTNP
ncbi:MAG: histidine--tRNA ligase [Brevinematia bacterium]